MEIFLISIVLVTIAFSGIAIKLIFKKNGEFSGIAIKLIFKKNGEFSGTCASQSPFLQNSDEPCGICGKIPTSSECANDSE